MDISRIIEKIDEAFSRNDMPEAGRLIEYWQQEFETSGDKRNELAIVNEMLGYYRKVKDEEKGLASIARSAELIEALKIENNLSTATIYLNMATTLKCFNKADEAEPYYKKCYVIYDANLEDNNPLWGGFYNNYGLCQQDLGQYDDAKFSFLYAAKLMQKVDNGKGDAAISYVNLAHLYDDMDEKEQAIESIKKAYELLMSEDNIKDGTLAFTFSKCVSSFEYFGFSYEASLLKTESERIYGDAQ